MRAETAPLALDLNPYPRDSQLHYLRTRYVQKAVVTARHGKFGGMRAGSTVIVYVPATDETRV